MTNFGADDGADPASEPTSITKAMRSALLPLTLRRESSGDDAQRAPPLPDGGAPGFHKEGTLLVDRTALIARRAAGVLYDLDRSRSPGTATIPGYVEDAFLSACGDRVSLFYRSETGTRGS